MGTFSDQIKAFSDKTKLKMNAGVAEIIRGVALSLVERSPVGDPTLWAPQSLPPPKGYEGGQFKANWQGGLNEINYLVTEDIDPTGEISLASINSKIPLNPAGSIFYITNSLPYAEALEDGHSTQAPFGMVTLTMLDLGIIFEKAFLEGI